MQSNSSYGAKPSFVNIIALVNQSENLESVIKSEQESVMTEV